MKKLITITMLLLVVLACKKDSKSNSTVNKVTKKNNDTYLTATINGKKFSSSVEVITFNVKNQTYLTTADNSDASEYAFNLIIKNDRDNDPKKLRYGFVEIKDANGNNTAWKLPNNFDFTSKTRESGSYLEGTFSFVANAFANGVEDNKNQLKITNGKYRAKRPGH